jgi:hypothetical protein
MMYFVVEAQLKDASFSNGACAQASSIDDQRFFAAKIPQSSGDAYVTVHTFQVNDTLYCKAFNGRTVAVVHVLEPKPRDQKMVVVKPEKGRRLVGSTAAWPMESSIDKADQGRFNRHRRKSRSSEGDSKFTIRSSTHRQPGAFTTAMSARGAGRGNELGRWSPTTRRLQAAAGAGERLPRLPASNDGDEGRPRTKACRGH